MNAFLRYNFTIIIFLYATLSPRISKRQNINPWSEQFLQQQKINIFLFVWFFFYHHYLYLKLKVKSVTVVAIHQVCISGKTPSLLYIFRRKMQILSFVSFLIVQSVAHIYNIKKTISFCYYVITFVLTAAI
uniref:Uncharacterized protein n=1 Tax=Cacopsylla melanoneura TaxID=428564 RepID=A0A8D9BGK5_9HEMI